MFARVWRRNAEADRAHSRCTLEQLTIFPTSYRSSSLVEFRDVEAPTKILHLCVNFLKNTDSRKRAINSSFFGTYIIFEIPSTDMIYDLVSV